MINPHFFKMYNESLVYRTSGMCSILRLCGDEIDLRAKGCAVRDDAFAVAALRSN